MPNEWTGADSLRMLNTGAVSAGASQEDPDASLGGYLSSTFVKTMKYVPGNVPSNIEIVYVSASNGEGTGGLVFSGSSASWQAPGSAVAGASVAIANGETKILADGEDAEKYIRISKISTEASTLIGTLELTYDENNAVVMDNAAEALALAGGFKYRSVGLSNGSAGAVTAVKVWAGPTVPAVPTDYQALPASGAGEIWSSEFVGVFPDDGYFAIYNVLGALKEVVYATRSTFGYDVASGDRGLLGTSATTGLIFDTFAPVYGAELATEAPIGDQITASADEDTPPVAISFTGAFTEATAVTVASIASGDWAGLHIKRSTNAGTLQTASLLGSLMAAFTAGGTDYQMPFSAFFKIANAEQWQLFVSEDGEFDFTNDPDAVSASLPITFPLSLPVSGDKDYWYVVRYRNRYGLTSLNQYARKASVNSGGVEVTLPPSSPFDTTLEDTFEGYVKVHTTYLKGDDDGYAANRWSVWASVGSDPDPDVDTPVSTRGIPDINLIGDGLEIKTNIGPYAEEADLRVVVRVFRTSDSVTDGNTDVVTLTTASGPDAPEDITAIM